MSKSIVNLIIGLIYATIITAIVFVVIYGKTLVIWCINGINGIKLPNLKLFSVNNSGTLLKILLAIAIVAIMGFIFKKFKRKGPKKAQNVHKSTSGKLWEKVLVFVALAITAYAFFYFGILAKLAKVLDIKILGADIPFIREILIVMTVMIIVGVITKISSTTRDMRAGIYRIWFPFVGQMWFAILWWMCILTSTLILVSLGYHYMVIGLMKIGWNFFDLKVGEGHGTIAIVLVSLQIWVSFAVRSYKPYIVYVPGVMGLVTESALGGEFYVYSSGIHFKYPWEIVRKEHFYPLETITTLYKEDFVSKDNGIVIAKGSFNYNADINNLINYHKISEETIVDGFHNLITGSLTVEIVKRTTEKARKETEEIKEAIEMLYKGKHHEKEEEYGVQFTDVTLGDIAYDAETQKALSMAFHREKIAAGSKKFNKMGQRQIENALLIEGKMTKAVHKLEIDFKEIDPAVVASLGSIGAAILKVLGIKKEGGEK